MKKIILPILVTVSSIIALTSCDGGGSDSKYLSWEKLGLSEFSIINTSGQVEIGSITNIQNKKNIGIYYKDPGYGEVAAIFNEQFNQIDEISHLESVGFSNGIKKIGTAGKTPFANNDKFKYIDFSGKVDSIKSVSITPGFFYVGSAIGDGVSIKINIPDCTDYTKIFSTDNFFKNPNSSDFTKIKKIYVNNPESFYEQMGKNANFWGKQLDRNIIESIENSTFGFNW